MENLIETLKNTVAFLMAMRIAVLIGLILLVFRLGYLAYRSPGIKRYWHERKRVFLRFKKVMKLH